MVLIASMIALYAVPVSSAEPVQIIVHSVKPSNSYGEIMVEVKNTSNKTLQKVYFNCGVFNQSGDMIGADEGLSENIPAGESDYKRELANIAKGSLQDVSSAKCRVTSIR